MEWNSPIFRSSSCNGYGKDLSGQRDFKEYSSEETMLTERKRSVMVIVGSLVGVIVGAITIKILMRIMDLQTKQKCLSDRWRAGNLDQPGDAFNSIDSIDGRGPESYRGAIWVFSITCTGHFEPATGEANVILGQYVYSTDTRMGTIAFRNDKQKINGTIQFSEATGDGTLRLIHGGVSLKQHVTRISNL
jgi:hypothetical protein